MKKSDKILLGGFVVVLLALTTIHVSLYATFKSGKHSAYNAENEFAADAVQVFPNILFVSLNNVSDVTVRFGDVAKIEKREDIRLTWTQNRDTLVINGEKGLGGSDRGLPSVQLPHNIRLSLFNSTISFESSRKKAASSPEIYLRNSRALFFGEEIPLVLDSARVRAESSSVAFRGNTQIGQLQVQLTKSSLEYMDGNPGKLTIVADSASVLSLSAKHLSGATLQLLPKE